MISDPQIDINNAKLDEELEVLRNCFINMDVDAVAVCGDITENALPQEMDIFFDTFKQHCLTQNLFVVPGNMDGVYDIDTQNVYLEALERFSDKKHVTLYFCQETDTCILIGISPEPVHGRTITDAQLDFLGNAMHKASLRRIPALIFCHFQLSDTLNVNWEYASLGSDTIKVKPILEKYSGKVIYFSGHIHRGFISKIGGSVITKGNVTYVSTPSICQPDTIHYNADNDSLGTGYIVDIRGESINIKGFDFLRNEWLSPFNWTI